MPVIKRKNLTLADKYVIVTQLQNAAYDSADKKKAIIDSSPGPYMCLALYVHKMCRQNGCTYRGHPLYSIHLAIQLHPL